MLKLKKKNIIKKKKMMLKDILEDKKICFFQTI